MMSRFVFIFLLGLVMPFAACAEESAFQQGRHYMRFNQPLPVLSEGVEVLEFFYYSCPHCRELDPYLEKWKKRLPAGVKFVQLPAIMNANGAIHAKVFYAAQELGVLSTVHTALFDALHVKRIPVFTEEEVGAFIKGLGLDEKQFLETMQSFQVDTKVRAALQTVRQYRVRSVPTVAINGRYMTNGRMAGTYDNLMKVIDYLVDKEIKENKT